MGIISATLMIFLPETNNAPLAQTIEEAEQFYERSRRKVTAESNELQAQESK